MELKQVEFSDMTVFIVPFKLNHIRFGTRWIFFQLKMLINLVLTAERRMQSATA